MAATPLRSPNSFIVYFVSSLLTLNFYVQCQYFSQCDRIVKSSVDSCASASVFFKFVFLPHRPLRLKSVKLISTGFKKSPSAITKYSKHGCTSLVIPGHDPPVDITISMDIELNPGPIMNNINLNLPLNLNSTSTLSPPCNLSPTLLSKITYSSADLYKIRCHSSISTPDCCPRLKELNIFRYRGKRGGRPRSLSLSVNNVNNRSPKPSTNVKNLIHFCLLNARSLNNKSLAVNDYIVERDLDIFAITETWLKNSSESDFVLRDVCPS